MTILCVKPWKLSKYINISIHLMHIYIIQQNSYSKIHSEIVNNTICKILVVSKDRHGNDCNGCGFSISLIFLVIDLWFQVGWWCLTPLSTIYQLYRDGQFYWWRKPRPRENHQPAQVTDTLYYMLHRVHLTISEIRTHIFSGDRQWFHR